MAAHVEPIWWEAPEHRHIEKSGDWYWAFGILALVGIGLAIYFGNILFAIVLALGAVLMVSVSLREPDIITFGITPRGIHAGEEAYAYTHLESFCIDETDPNDPQLLLRSKRPLRPIIVLPIPQDAIDDIDRVLAARLPEEHLEESIAHRLLEFLGF